MRGKGEEGGEGKGERRNRELVSSNCIVIKGRVGGMAHEPSCRILLLWVQYFKLRFTS